jgi:hypothetical protein
LIPGALFACNFFVTRVILLPPHGETKSMPVCDGCGAQVDDAHIRARIERLEMATRYRPIHIQVLLLGVAPPPRPEDYFYRVAESGTDRSPGGRAFFDTLIRAAGESPERFTNESQALAEFQRRGLFFVHVVECPAIGSEREAALERCATSLVKRIQFSYRPKHVAPLFSELGPVIPLLAAAGMSDRLILDRDQPFDLGARLVEAVTEKLAKAASTA